MTKEQQRLRHHTPSRLCKSATPWGDVSLQIFVRYINGTATRLSIGRLYLMNTYERSYHSDSTASRLLSKVKHNRARLVLRWENMLGSLVLFFCFLFFCRSNVLAGWSHFFGWLAALACGSGIFGQLILIVLALLVIVAASSACLMV